VRVKHHNHRASSPLYTLTLNVSRVCAGGAHSWRGRPPCASWAAPAPAAEVYPQCPTAWQAYHSRARVPEQLRLSHLQAVEVITRANADEKAGSKQLTRKAIVPLSIADDARGDDTYDDENIKEAEVEEAEAEAAPIEEAAPAPAPEEAPP